MIGVDTNVLVHAADEDAPLHGPCRELLEGARGAPQTLCPTWSVVCEFLRVITHRRVLARPFTMEQAWATAASFLAMPHVSVLGPGPRHLARAPGMLAAPGVSGNLVHDAHIAAVLVEHGVHRIYTFDQDLRRFPGLEVVDPLA